MIQMGPIELGEKARIACPVTDRTPVDRITEAIAGGLDIVEFRIDLFDDLTAENVVTFTQGVEGAAKLATIRCEKEGGQWTGSDDDRLALFEAVAPHVDAMDIELSSTLLVGPVIRIAEVNDCRSIVSAHDFDRLRSYEWLETIDDAGRSAGADIVKVAVKCNSQDDFLALARFTMARQSGNLVSIGMGDRGAASRLLFPALGSLFTFASLDKATAPGQLTFEETRDLLERLFPGS
jgi:3-dehydroquinate dehydratase-1